MRERGIEHVIAGMVGVDVAAGVVHTDRGELLGYDQLVIATGAAARPDEVPGLSDYGRQVCVPAQMRELREDLRRLAGRASMSRRERVLLAVPVGNLCPGPLYDLAFMIDTWLRGRGVRDAVEIAFTTYETSYLREVNPMAHEMTSCEFDAKCIDAATGAELIKVNEREAVYADGTTRPFDIIVAFPPQVAAVEYEGLPTDGRGFLRCELETRAVLGHPEIHAPGDAGDYPAKLAYLATMQGTATAMDIAAQLRGTALGRQL
jgi:sulfide:quinone oxidoreductase